MICRNDVRHPNIYMYIIYIILYIYVETNMQTSIVGAVSAKGGRKLRPRAEDDAISLCHLGVLVGDGFTS